RDGRVVGVEGAAQDAVVLGFRPAIGGGRRGRGVGGGGAAVEVPVWGQEQGALQTDAAFDRLAEVAGGALAEQDVSLGEVEEDELEEFGEAEDLSDGGFCWVVHCLGSTLHAL
ncbi:hypothetical protein Tdes44962_MAKER06659, partial [Teratosphaeria destructans]